MKDFVAAVALISRIKDAAEAADHHPDLHLTGYRSLAVELSTHSIGALSEKDFRLAAKIDKLPKKLKDARGLDAMRISADASVPRLSGAA